MYIYTSDSDKCYGVAPRGQLVSKMSRMYTMT